MGWASVRARSVRGKMGRLPTCPSGLPQKIMGLAAILVLLAGCGSPAAEPVSLPPATSAAPTSLSANATASLAATAGALSLPATAPSLPARATLSPSPTAAPTAAPAVEGSVEGLSEEETATLGSLVQVDDYPLYTMRYHGSYRAALPSPGTAGSPVEANGPGGGLPAGLPAWACSLFAALGDDDRMLYGRNFDWQYSPALLLFADPPDGYASVSMVDIAYLLEPGQVDMLVDLPLTERTPLLYAPTLPFDGMNEHGLTIGMAAVPGSTMPREPGRETIGSLGIIREMLDHARNVDEALEVMQSYNISMEGGPPIHYLVADRSGRAVLIEFSQGEMVQLPNEAPWHQATNFLRSEAGETGGWDCPRYDRIEERLVETGGQLSAEGAIELLEEVDQPITQWSVVYGITSGEVQVSMGREYDAVHSFQLEPVGR